MNGCNHVVQAQPTYLCRRPIVQGETFCARHGGARITKPKRMTPLMAIRLVLSTACTRLARALRPSRRHNAT